LVRRKEKRRSFTPEEVRYLLEAAKGDRLEALLITALTTAMRPCELYGLTRNNISLSKAELFVENDLTANEEGGHIPVLGPTKTESSRRRIPLPPMTVAALREHLQRGFTASGFVFASPSGRAVRHSNLVRRWWKPLLKRAADLAAKDGVDFPTDLSPYALRHTSVELAMLAGVGYDLVAERMGHASPRTTYASYRNISGQRHRDAADRIDAFITGGLREAK
jgi:integrase